MLDIIHTTVKQFEAGYVQGCLVGGTLTVIHNQLGSTYVGVYTVGANNTLTETVVCDGVLLSGTTYPNLGAWANTYGYPV